jgi:hypothetical protein
MVQGPAAANAVCQAHAQHSQHWLPSARWATRRWNPSPPQGTSSINMRHALRGFTPKQVPFRRASEIVNASDGEYLRYVAEASE